MSELIKKELEIAWPQAAWVHPNFLNYLKVGTMSGKTDDYIKEIGVTTDRELQIHELQLFCNNLTDELCEDLIDGVRTVKWVEEGDNYIVTFTKAC